MERDAPGADTGRTLISHDVGEGGIISGHMEVTVGEKTQVLGPGNAPPIPQRGQGALRASERLHTTEFLVVCQQNRQIKT